MDPIDFNNIERAFFGNNEVCLIFCKDKLVWELNLKVLVSLHSNYPKPLVKVVLHGQEGFAVKVKLHSNY